MSNLEVHPDAIEVVFPNENEANEFSKWRYSFAITSNACLLRAADAFRAKLPVYDWYEKETIHAASLRGKLLP